MVDRQIEKVVHIYKRDEEPKSYVYWLTKPVEERIAAMSILRERYFQMFKHESTGRLQRVYKIIDKK